MEGFPGGIVVKNPPANSGDMGSIPGTGRSPGVGNGNPLQYSCQENSMDSSLAGYSPWRCKELDMTEHAHMEYVSRRNKTGLFKKYRSPLVALE